MKAIKNYLLNVAQAFEMLANESKPALIIAPIVVGIIVAIIGSIYCGCHDMTFFWCLLKGMLWGLYAFLFLNILWWGLFLLGVLAYTIIQAIGNWSKKP